MDCFHVTMMKITSNEGLFKYNSITRGGASELVIMMGKGQGGVDHVGLGTVKNFKNDILTDPKVHK